MSTPAEPTQKRETLTSGQVVARRLHLTPVETATGTTVHWSSDNGLTTECGLNADHLSEYGLIPCPPGTVATCLRCRGEA